MQALGEAESSSDNSSGNECITIVSQEHVMHRFPNQNNLLKKKSLLLNISASRFIKVHISYDPSYVILVNFLKIKVIMK